MFVYMLINLATEMSYVGSTVDLKKRIQGHRKDAKNGSTWRLHQAIREYGWGCFDLVVLAECSSQDELDSTEQLWMQYLDTLNPNVGYNDQLPQKKGRSAGADMSEEEKERYRAYGRRALKARSREFYRECGKKSGLSRRTNTTT